MTHFEIGDTVRIDIPDETDPDYEKYHGLHGKITEIIEDSGSNITGDNRDDNIYRIKFNDKDPMDFRRRDLRPPLNE